MIRCPDRLTDEIAALARPRPRDTPWTLERRGARGDGVRPTLMPSRGHPERPGWYERIMVRFAATPPGAWLFLNVLTRVDRLLIRATGGRVSSAIGTGFHPHVVLLTTTGARTGQPRVVPLLAFRSGSRLVLIASRGGHPRHPAWYRNLRAHAPAAVTVQGRTDLYLAREAEGAERARLWREAVAFYPGYAAYQARAGRPIPVMVLEPAVTPSP